MFKVVFFVPHTHVDEVKVAVFDAGAGRLGAYDFASWQTRGIGQFRPLPESDPFLGDHGRVEHVDEWRVEVICPEAALPDVLRSLIEAHPYEEPAYEAYRVYQLSDLEGPGGAATTGIP